MKIKVIAVGKIKEDYITAGIDRCIKNISKNHQIEISEVQDEKTPDKASSKEMDMIKNTEGKRILSKISQDSYIIALDIQGKTVDTPRLKTLIGEALHTRKEITFIIGGSLGISEDILRKSDYRLSFSKMTFPHQLMRFMLLNQIEKII